ncbi:DUF1836 domain-containing protein [Sedimentibacter sp. zth1]|uniref:DUF1836 domain-containing protein n=1 Tax=Sedimentibacter sp. zth1 TaxID=2816908 RepID=UPI001A932260|nr:DUF1836 domain-containing protein [Sedimentibacter sp. zth1]QSX07070.1 DUF1836 domain-containing protein [Sedimentibacter sp. zth1]
MENKDILNLLNNFSLDNNIQYNKIPNIALYMEQVLTFLNEELEQYKTNDDDKLYTKSMINNYVKAQILTKPNNKKYTSNQVVEIIIIFYLKQILTIDDIKSLFDNTLDKNNIKNVYDLYLNYTTKALSNTNSEIEQYLDLLSSDENIKNDDERIFTLIGLLTAKANYYKLFSQKLINTLRNDFEEKNKDNEKKSKELAKQSKDAEKEKKEKEKIEKQKEKIEKQKEKCQKLEIKHSEKLNINTNLKSE